MKYYFVTDQSLKNINEVSVSKTVKDAYQSFGVYEDNVATVYEVTLKPLKKVTLGIQEIPLKKVNSKGKK